ncbi:MAG: hypothetical protein ACLU38_09285 [Dysosmobacter sp.]
MWRRLHHLLFSCGDGDGLLQSGKTGLGRCLYTALSLLLGVTVVLLGQRLVR